MKRVAICAWALTSLAACNDPTQPADAPATSPAPAVAAVQQQFTLRNLGTLGGGSSLGNGINERGEVVGVAELPSGTERAFLWRAGEGMRNLGTLGNASTTSRARGINDRGEVVGASEIRARLEPGIPLDPGAWHAKPGDLGWRPQ